jgi:hypothetical protein
MIGVRSLLIVVTLGLTNLFPQSRGRRPSVEYLPLSYDRPASPPEGAGERGRRRVPARQR